MSKKTFPKRETRGSNPRESVYEKETCPVCGFPCAFPELSLKEAYQRCVERHQVKAELLD